jgi:hypothetical protein
LGRVWRGWHIAIQPLGQVVSPERFALRPVNQGVASFIKFGHFG